KSVRKNSYKPLKRKAWYYCSRCYSSGSWDRYSYQYLHRAGNGAYFMKKFHNTLKRAYKKFGVEPEYITAIIGIESEYGSRRGDYFVFDRLVHLSFDKNNRRAKFYRKQLISLLRLSAREDINPKDIRGSSSGAIGLAQFIPSTYKLFAVDFNKDGKKQMNNVVDAIGSIAYYLKKHGWRKGEDVAVRVRYEGNRFDKLPTGYTHTYYRNDLEGIEPRDNFNYHGKVSLIKLEKHTYDELWYGGKNFYIITRYNQNSYYAMSVHQLAQKIKREYIKRYKKYF
ncbi:MAG: lytic murein transglycosylase, partial [Sulfurovaceae bacterium]|nr:lytic murein transglycosylase [Sulfurovaceae bacterium]